MPPFDQYKAYAKLCEHARTSAGHNLRALFEEDATRFARMHLEVGPVLLDYAKNRVTSATLALLFELAREAGVEERRAQMFRGEAINVTERRPALHVALRAPRGTPWQVGKQDVAGDVHAVLGRMANFAEGVRSGNIVGARGHKLRHIVHLGIGGSDLGPVMATEALKPYMQRDLKLHFVSNVDATHLVEALAQCRAEETLFVIASKTFTTQETMANARSARAWFFEQGFGQQDVAKHFVALSTHRDEVEAFGIDAANMFGFWDWVGGRYSMWSAIGLSIMLAIGAENFHALLRGARAMDEHFVAAPLEQNMPVILALLGVWYINFLGYSSHAILPYEQYLHRFAAYLQQADMESNGKHTTLTGERVRWMTGPLLWGEPGTNGQHAFFQLLHQGTHIVPADFIAAKHSVHDVGEHHRLLLANFLAQTEALMRGKTDTEAQAELEAQGLDPERVRTLLPHKIFEGNRPTNSIVLERLDPFGLGHLVALYEHKVFVQGAIWGINSFDQWGVELGKQLAQRIVPELKEGAALGDHDASTLGLIRHLRT